MIYFSHRTRKTLADGQAYLPFGAAHYSYGSVCQKFVQLFTDSGMPSQELIMPEVYANAAQLTRPAGARRPLHVAFKPYEEIRLLKGAANIAHVAWEFDKVPTFAALPHDHPRRNNALNDYVHVLGLMSEVWVGCDYTKSVFAAHGLSHVKVMPAPIGVAPKAVKGAGMAHNIRGLEFTRAAVARCLNSTGAPRLNGATINRAGECRATGGRVFMSVFNPGDPRKNAAALFMGFQEYLCRSKRNDLLIVKLVLDGSPESLRLALSEKLPKYFAYDGVPFSFIDCNNIILVPDRLTPDELATLYEAADFYICPSAAEGQGLPVQEAMAAGLVPISTVETAMADYIKEDHAIIMAAHEAPIPLQVAETYGLSGVTWRVTGLREIVQALSEAADMTQDDYVRRSRAAQSFIQKHYGFAAIGRKVAARVKELAA